MPVQAPARTNHSRDGQRGGACDAALIPAPWGLNLPGSARALQQVLLVHGLHAASPGAPSQVARGTMAARSHLPPSAPVLPPAPCARPLYPRPSPPRVKPPAARRVQKPAGRGKGGRLQRESPLCPQDSSPASRSPKGLSELRPKTFGLEQRGKRLRRVAKLGLNNQNTHSSRNPIEKSLGIWGSRKSARGGGTQN